MHDEERAGISAFINKITDQWERNALMLAVGALVPLDQGRLGRSWKHAEKLKELAQYDIKYKLFRYAHADRFRELVLDPSNTQPLEDYWTSNHLVEDDAVEDSRPGSSSQASTEYRPRPRPTSGISGISVPPFGLSSYHPALALPALIDSFGPLVFPLYKAALLRKRILLMHEAPVELACNFVYNISILSNIPSSVSELIPLEPLPTRLQPLFSVGIHDIDELSHKGRHNVDGQDPGYGWIACSTDDVLTVKTDIYDALVNIPPVHSEQAREKVWPHVKNAVGQELKASQRDLRRYRTLRASIKRTFPRINTASPVSGRTRPSKEPSTLLSDGDLSDDENAPLLTSESSRDLFSDASSTHDDRLIEPMSWSALAYNSFMWWASAGEKRAGLEEEIEHDNAMFRDFERGYGDTPGTGGRARSAGGPRRGSTPTLVPGAPLMTDGASFSAPEMAIIAFFHRLTAVILSTLAKLVEQTDAENDTDVDAEAEADAEHEAETENPAPAAAGDGASESQGADINGAQQGSPPGSTDDDHAAKPSVYVGSDDMVRMGLDVWSHADKRFVEELVELYWGRRAEVQGGRIECCGVRIL